MSAESSPSQTPTVASMSLSQKQRMPPTLTKSSPLASGSSTPASPETATFANSGGRRVVSDMGKPLPAVNAAEVGESAAAGAAVAGGSKPARGGRARDLLRQHYGLGVGPPAPVPGRVDDPMDIDSKVFDAKAYYEQLITTSSLTALLKKENELAGEIRQLEGEKQSLVYNHHHELIAASDTIRAMKTQADSLDSDLERLRMSFSDISRLVAEVTRDEE
ncbi:hypothetical protein M408DRAFT_326294 [Serendipita vermifera MAFF 305830]|uniref:Vacuolar protein sorting-associated protein 51 homolog n=1 Tax=Serendipita vermifera MAFF 305830 TaxID=933852 RepID=A0A0C3BQC9_SERVB|nr:hypothetical protein M408DRAFT_326294 [Serendipita vermifera MAFF 305830]